MLDDAPIFKHKRSPRFNKIFSKLEEPLQELATKTYNVLKQDPLNSKIQFGPLASKPHIWSARVGWKYRALAENVEPGLFVWFWIGTHAEYNKILSKKPKDLKADKPKETGPDQRLIRTVDPNTQM